MPEAKTTLFSLVKGNVTILDPAGDIYILMGRAPFDEDDTVVVVQAKDQAQAEDHLNDELYEACADEEDVKKERTNNERKAGCAYMVNYVACVARHQTI